MYHNKSLHILMVVSTFWSPLIYSGKDGKKEKKSSSLKKSDLATFTAYKRLVACRDALKESIEAKRHFLQTYPKATTHTSLDLCNLLSAIFKNQAEFLQARQEAESQRELMLVERNQESFQLLVNTLAHCNDTLLYEHSENRHHAPDTSLTRGSTIPEFPPKTLRRSIPLSLLSSGAVSESSLIHEAADFGISSQREPLAKAGRSKTAEGLTRDTFQEQQYVRTPSFLANAEKGQTESHYGKIPVRIAE